MNVTSDIKTAADAPLSSKYLPGVEVYQNQADYSARNGGAACPWNPAISSVSAEARLDW